MNNESMYNGILDVRDGISSEKNFGLNSEV
jgi:hypothetical protein